MRDPLHDQILRGLERMEPDQNDAFERCMGDVLALDFPGLVPVPGGSDGGVDGAVPDPSSGTPFPLVCTVGRDVIGNLTESLKRCRIVHPGQRRVVSATSQRLTPRRRGNLAKRANELGFELVQIYTREAVADRLYRSQRWCMELLGIPGSLPALSILPPTERLCANLELSGRDQEIEQLGSGAGDIVVVGQPGSGKSALLAHLARTGWALFVNSEDETAIVAAIRQMEPTRLILDDAHARPIVLEQLLRIRRETGCPFPIVATTWPGQAEAIVRRFGGPPLPRRMELELLPRQEIAKLYQEMGVRAHGDVLRWMLDQAANKPGVAVLLGLLFLGGRWQEVLDGSALAEELLARFLPLVGDKAEPLLGVLALSGDPGLDLGSARECLEADLVQLYGLANGLVLGGILQNVADDRLAVWPRPLRAALVRRVFFTQGRARLPYRPVLDRLPDKRSATGALVAAAALGAEVPGEALRDLVQQHGGASEWSLLAAAEAHVDWVLESYQGALEDIADEVLVLRPQRALPMLLSAADLELEDTASRLTRRAFDPIQAWIRDLDLESESQAVARRRFLANAAVTHLETGGAKKSAAEALALALSPRLESTSSDPVDGRTVRIRSAVLRPAAIEEMESVWRTVQQPMAILAPTSWHTVDALLWDWSHLDSVAPVGALADDHLEAGRRFARRIVDSLWERCSSSVGVRAALRRHAARLELQLPDGGQCSAAESLFEQLFPADATSADGARELESQARENAKQLAAALIQQGARSVCRRLSTIETEAQAIGHRWPRFTPDLCRALAELAGNPTQWAREALNGLPGDLVLPFVERAVEQRSAGWDDLLLSLLQDEATAGLAAWPALQAAVLPEPVEAALMYSVPQLPQVVEALSSSGKIPTPRSFTLLEHSDSAVAVAAAVGEWLREPRGQIEASLQRAWRKALLRGAGLSRPGDGSGGSPYWLASILSQDSLLAFEWLRAHLRRAPTLRLLIRSTPSDPIGAALDALDRDQRRALLTSVPCDESWSAFVARLVGSDPEVYQLLLSDGDRRTLHAAPLRGGVRKSWRELAKLAIGASVPPEEVASETLLGGGWSWTGTGLEYWQARLQEIADACRGEQELQCVSAAARALIATEIDQAQRRQKKIDLHGAG